jgi:hypothetical protein
VASHFLMRLSPQRELKTFLNIQKVPSAMHDCQ